MSAKTDQPATPAKPQKSPDLQQLIAVMQGRSKLSAEQYIALVARVRNAS